MNRIKQWFNFNWDNFRVQMIGAGMLFPAFWCAIRAANSGLEIDTRNAAAWLVTIGVLDLWICFIEKKKSISSWIIALFPAKVDKVLIFAFVAFVFWQTNILITVWYVHGLLNSHFNQN